MTGLQKVTILIALDAPPLRPHRRRVTACTVGVVQIQEGEVWVVKDVDTGDIIYRAGGGMLQTHGMDPDRMYSSLRHVDSCVKTNMAGKRGVATGNGFIGAMGIRYRYTEPVLSEREKLAPTAAIDGHLYNSLITKVQSVANLMVGIVSTWSDELRTEMAQLRERMKLILPVSGASLIIDSQMSTHICAVSRHCVRHLSDGQHW